MYPREFLLNRKVVECCHIEITDRCNLFCIHCDYPKCYRNSNDLEVEYIRSVLDELKNMGTYRVTISGGEPLCHPNALEIIKLAVEMSFSVKLISNGYYLTEEICNELKKLPRFELALSMHGIGEVHDKITGKRGSFSALDNAISYLKGGKARVSIQSSVMRANIENLDALVSYATDREIEYKFDPYITGSEKINRIGTLRVNDEQLTEYYLNHTISIKLAQRLLGEKEPIRLPSCDCGMALTTLTIGPNGDVYPCGNIRVGAGNIKKDSIRNIWNQSKMLQMFRARLSSPRETCNLCDMASLCNQCIAMSIMEHGEWEKPAVECCRHMNVIKNAWENSD